MRHAQDINELLSTIVTRKTTCAIQWVPTHVNIEENKHTDSLAKEAKNIDSPPIKTTSPDVNAIATHRLCDSPRKKWCLPELNHDHVVTTTISRMLVGHMRGMKIMPDGSRTYTEGRHCPGVQLNPGISSIASLLPRPSSI
ncbi:RNase H domain-containing protein [Trichonephila clavipes]|nr:RNase H domain-containing protein [Trichonephila clavipes]